MNSVSYDISILLDQSTDLVNLENLFRSREPTNPPNVVTLYDIPGAGIFQSYERNEPGTNFSRYIYSSLQVRVRDISEPAGMARAWEIFNILDHRGNEEINGVRYGLISATDTPTILNWDDNNRVIIITNYEIQRELLIKTGT